jgi:hypothetical protein
VNSKTLGARMNGAVTAPKEVSQPKRNTASQRNRYFIFDKDPIMRFMESPKEAARRVMCESMREVSAAGR